MSVRFFKVFTGVFIFHLVGAGLVWVGFSAPVPKPPAVFIYEGEFPAGDSGSRPEEAWPKGKASDQFAVDRLEASYFNHWIRLREPSKPITYDERLGKDQ